MVDERTLRERLEWLAEHYLMTREERAWLAEATKTILEDEPERDPVAAYDETYGTDRMDMTTCPDCGASPAEMRCECDYAGIRVQRRIAELERERDEASDKRALHQYVWSCRPRFLAVAQAHSVQEARQALLQTDLGDSGDGSCCVHDEAREHILSTQPSIWYGVNAEFEITDSAAVEEAESAYRQMRDQRDEALSAHADRVAELEALTERYQQAISERRGLLGLVRARLERVNPSYPKQHMLDLVERVASSAESAEAAEARERALRENMDAAAQIIQEWFEENEASCKATLLGLLSPELVIPAPAAPEPKPSAEEQLKVALKAIHSKYGSNLYQFFVDIGCMPIAPEPKP